MPVMLKESVVRFEARIGRAVKAVDQLGKMGQREMARTYRIALRILMTAGGAGLVTAGTVILKVIILHRHGPCADPHPGIADEHI